MALSPGVGGMAVSAEAATLPAAVVAADASLSFSSSARLRSSSLVRSFWAVDCFSAMSLSSTLEAAAPLESVSLSVGVVAAVASSTCACTLPEALRSASPTWAWVVRSANLRR